MTWHAGGTQQLQDGRTGDRQDAVLGAGRPAAERDRRRHEPVEAERVQSGADADHVGERVECPDLVEVHVVRGNAVHDRLCFGKRAKGGQCPFADRGGEWRVSQQLADMYPGAAAVPVVMLRTGYPTLVGIRVVGVRVVGVRVRGDDVDAGRGEPGSRCCADLQPHIKLQRADRVGNDLGAPAGTGECADHSTEQHVPAHTAGQVEPPDSSPPGRRGPARLGEPGSPARYGWLTVRGRHSGVGHPSTLVRGVGIAEPALE